MFHDLVILLHLLQTTLVCRSLDFTHAEKGQTTAAAPDVKSNKW